jgi:hypothetical protein
VEIPCGRCNLEALFSPGICEKAGSFFADRLVRYGGSICAQFTGLSTAIYNILWLSFRANARCGQMCMVVEKRWLVSRGSFLVVLPALFSQVAAGLGYAGAHMTDSGNEPPATDHEPRTTGSEPRTTSHE